MKEEINKVPGSMSFSRGFFGPPRVDKKHHYTDYHELYSILSKLNYEDIERIDIGLAGDMDYTGGTIYENGVFYENCYFHDNSCWAEPCIVIYSKINPVKTIYIETDIEQKDTLKEVISKLKLLE